MVSFVQAMLKVDGVVLLIKKNSEKEKIQFNHGWPDGLEAIILALGFSKLRVNL